MGRRVRLAKQRVVTPALLIRRVSYGEADLVVTLFTAQMGVVSAMARGARRSSKRLSAIEPLHLLRVSIDVVPSREMATLAEAQLERPRMGLMRTLAHMDVAGQALRWAGKIATARTPEPVLWRLLNEVLDRLEMVKQEEELSGLLAEAGLRMLAVAGWEHELQSCIRCSKRCPLKARAFIDVRAGGLVCRACGGAGLMLRSHQRGQLHAALHSEDMVVMDAETAELACRLVDRTLVVHGKGEST